MRLTTYERQLLAHFILQTSEDQQTILAAAIADPRCSGPLIAAYRAALTII